MDDAVHPTAIHDDDWEAALVAKANGDVPDVANDDAMIDATTSLENIVEIHCSSSSSAS